MATKVGAGLARIVVVAPKRRLDVAVPEQLPLAGVLPTLLKQGGEDLGNDGLDHGGWKLCRPDGAVLDPAKSLAAMAVRDGEVLHLVPRNTEWPELQYDDVVDAIAHGARQSGPPWTNATTRAAGLAGTVVVLAALAGMLLFTGGRWVGSGIALVALGAVLVGAGVLLSRALADSVAGGIVGAVGTAYGFLGGFLVLGGTLPLSAFGAPQLLVGAGVLVLLAVVGYAGVADLGRLFVAGAVAGLGGLIGGLIGLTTLDAARAAAIVLTVFLVMAPGFPLLSVRLAKVPMPAVPRTADELMSSDGLPSLQETAARVRRSGELLTGALLGTGIVAAVGVALLAASHGGAALILAGIVSAAFLLRARLFVAIRQRVAMLIGGVGGALATLAGLVTSSSVGTRLGILLPALVVVAGLCCAAGLLYSRRRPSPYLGRLADIADVVLTLGSAPVAASVLGLYQTVRGLAG